LKNLVGFSFFLPVVNAKPIPDNGRLLVGPAMLDD
jgi:hypothetical protein